MTPQNYAQTIDTQVATWLAGRQPATPFLDIAFLLGGPSAWANEGAPDDEPDGRRAELAAILKSPEIEPVVSSAWLQLLHGYRSEGKFVWGVEATLIEGLLQKDRWRSLLDNEDDSYAFAGLVVRLVQTEEADNAAQVEFGRVGSADALHFMLNEWLKPEPGQEISTSMDVVRALFGDAWSSVVFEALPKNESPAKLFSALRPPFMPGRVNTRLQETEKLPSLD